MLGMRFVWKVRRRYLHNTWANLNYTETEGLTSSGSKPHNQGSFSLLSHAINWTSNNKLGGNPVVEKKSDLSLHKKY